MPRTRLLRVDPRLKPMPNFSSNGYAPSRARKRRQLNCSNQEAINSLAQEWHERQEIETQLWLQQNPEPDVQILPPGNAQDHPNQENLQDDQQLDRQSSINPNIEQQIHDLVENLQAADPRATPPNEIHAQNVHIPVQRISTANNDNSGPLPMDTDSNTFENNLFALVQRLQQSTNHFTTDQNLVSNSDSASASPSTSLSKIKLGRDVHQVMQDFHLLPLSVLEELRHMRHVKLWFFTNEGLEKTRLAKEKTGRYNTSRVTFDFDKQGLVTENEYEATLKGAPEDNVLTPDQLNQSMPRYIDSIKHANWPTEVVNMFEKFFEDVQRHYESRAKAIGRYYTIAQAVFELRNKFHAHVKHHREALVLSLNPSELDRIREELRAQRDEGQQLIDAYRSSQREVCVLF